MITDERTPVTVLTGFLGAGKTTLLNRILTENHGMRVAVIQNEYGEIGIDHELVINADEEIFEMNNGCICCTVRGDLIRVLNVLMRRRDKFDRILVETTGLADPGPVAQTFFVDDDVKDALFLDGIVTLVDSAHASHHIDDNETWLQQVAFADVIVLNKTDLAESPNVDSLERRLRGMNRNARYHRAERGALDLDNVLKIGGFALDDILEVKPDFLEKSYPFEWAGLFDLPAGQFQVETLGEVDHHDHDHDESHSHDHAHDHDHDGGHPTDSHSHQHSHGHAHEHRCGVACAAVDATDLEPFTHGCDKLLRLFGSEDKDAETLRADGPAVFVGGDESITLALDAPGRVLIAAEHGARRLRGEDGSVYQSRDSVRFDADHHHDDEVSSIGLVFDGEMKLDKLEFWMSKFLEEKGADIYRMKGIFNLEDSPNRYVFQGVHMTLDGDDGKAWGPDEQRQNRVVFIGRELDRDAITESLLWCVE